jgi:transcriptional regulator with XRE-family HTH domain
VNTFTDTRLPHPPSPSPPLLTGLGRALRWLRERQARKQYRVADDAGITKGMLSAYETGRQRPSLETLDRLLAALGSDLNDLHNALQIVNGRPERLKGWSGWQVPDPGLSSPPSAGGDMVHERGLILPGAGSPGGSWAPAGSAAAGELREAPPHVALGGPGRAKSAAPDAPHAPDATNAADATDAETARAANALRDLYRVLGWDQPRLAAAGEYALSQMLAGFHGLLRYWHRSLVELRDAGKVGGTGKAGGETGAPSETGDAGETRATGGPERAE